MTVGVAAVSWSVGDAQAAPPEDLGHLTASGLGERSDMAVCLLPLLQALGWRGAPRRVAEALPHFASTLDLTGLRNVMGSLDYASRRGRMHIREVDPRLMPCLFVPDRGPSLVLLSLEKDGLHVVNGGSGEREVIVKPRGAGDAYFFSPAEDSLTDLLRPRVTWFRAVLARFRPLIWQTLGVTLLSNLLALATPLFVMAVYDKVVNSGSTTTLRHLGVGVAIALIGDLFLKVVRARIIGFTGARLDHIVGTAVFQRLLHLAPAFTERSTVGAQVSRLKDFESVREFFVGPLAMVFFEAPFLFIHLLVIALLGSYVAVVPFAAVVVFLVLGISLLPIVRDRVTAAAKAEAVRHEFIVESTMKMRAIKQSGAEPVWQERYRKLSADAAFATFRTQRVTAALSVSSHIVVVLSGLATMAIGAGLVLNQAMSVGALIACMILTWRVLAPLQTGFMTFTQLQQIQSSVSQVDNLMTLQPERSLQGSGKPVRRFKGRVSIGRVSLRYTTDTDPALIGVSLEAQPGEVIAVIGPNGAGKSTLLRLLMGMYQPQAGSIRIDGVDIRQLDPVELRAAIGYVPQEPQLFFGTIAQNLRLAEPTATDEELRWACGLAGCLSDIEKLPDGFETRFGDGRDDAAMSLVQRVSLARAYLKRAPIMLFDEPANGLDFEADRLFIETIRKMRGQSTVFIVTHRPSHLRLADRIVVLDGGYVKLSGPRDQVMERIPQELL